MTAFDEYEFQQPKRPTEAEYLEAFPEAKQIIPKKLKELEQRRAILVDSIKEQLKTIKTESDEFSRWFCRKLLKLNEGEELVALDKDIARLRRQLAMINGFKQPKGSLTDDQIQAARDVSIESLLDEPLKRRGHDFVTLCPLPGHDEKSPSFHIYTKDNRGWCFGCSRGGDVLALTMLIHDCSFPEAVHLLIGARP